MSRFPVIYVMIPGLPLTSILQCKQNRNEEACRELFQPIGRFEPTFIDAHPASKKICKVTSLKSRIKTYSFLEDIRTSSIEVFKDCESDTVVGMRNLDNPTQEAAKIYVIVMQSAGS